MKLLKKHEIIYFLIYSIMLNKCIYFAHCFEDGFSFAYPKIYLVIQKF